ncbi:Rossmann fold domain-containing protein [Aurantiacibacter luteus]|uniref:Rossmann fold domain-containing protein n=1 Tax=Aurantiacibacter luteus TaxID=1581420 RepID=UPI00069B84AF|nr:hypothetical protein [Aurantiacibacter luteus]
MKLIDARDLPGAPLDAAIEFARAHMAEAREADTDLAVLLSPADHTHASWRKAVIEELAREAAPRRVNAVVAPDETAANEVLDFLARAPGVTGQVLEVAGAAA